MAVTIKKAVLWRRDVQNEPGVLAQTLRPLVEAGVNLEVCMGYAIPGEKHHSAIEVYPITAKAEEAAKSVNLVPAETISCLIVHGDDEKGLGHKIAEALGNEGINISFVVVHAFGGQWHGVMGFESENDADRGMSVIKQATKGVKGKRGASGRKSAGKKTTTAKKTAARRTGRKKPTASKGGRAKKITKTAGKKSTKTAGKKTTRTAGKRSTTKKGASKSKASKSATRKKTTKRGKK